MKLYTEEQVREVLSNMLLTTEQVESIFEELTPIELPSDEEIEKVANSQSHYEGAMWFKYKILNQNNNQRETLEEWKSKFTHHCAIKPKNNNMAQQTAVEWLIEQLVELDKELDGRRKSDDSTVIKINPTKIYKQAKQMEKEQTEISDAGKDTSDYIDRHIIESMKELAIEGFKPQTPEISDEEIEKAADKYVSEDEFNRLLECFEQGAKWYREQLKKK